jgi:hypothetical protein
MSGPRLSELESRVVQAASPVDPQQRPEERRKTIARPCLVLVEVIVLWLERHDIQRDTACSKGATPELP